MRRRLSILLYKYEPRLLSRSTTILKPSSNTCCSISSRIFEGDMAFCFSLFVVRLREEAGSVSTGGILIVEISRDEMVGQPRQRRLTQSPRRIVAASLCRGVRAKHGDTAPRLQLHNSVAQELVFSG